MSFPTSIEAAEYFQVAYDNLSTTLTEQFNSSDTTCYVTSTENFPSSGWFICEDDICSYTGKTAYSFTGVTHGVGGTTPADHVASKVVSLTLNATAWNRVITELRAAQTKIGADSSAVTSSLDYKVIQLETKLSAGITDKTRPINLTPAGATIPATNGAEQTQVNGTNFSYYVLNFDKATDEKAYWFFIVPEKYDGGNVVFNVWCKTTVTTGNVMWVIKTVDVADGATFDSALSTTIAFDAKAVDGTAGDAFIASKTSDPGWTAGRYAIIELSRDADNASDTADADVSVLMIEINYEVV